MNKLQTGDAIRNITQDQWSVLRFVANATNIKKTPVFDWEEAPLGHIVYGRYLKEGNCLFLSTDPSGSWKNFIPFEKFISLMIGISSGITVNLSESLKVRVDDDGAVINGENVSHESISELYKASQYFTRNQRPPKQF